MCDLCNSAESCGKFATGGVLSCMTNTAQSFRDAIMATFGSHGDAVEIESSVGTNIVSHHAYVNAIVSVADLVALQDAVREALGNPHLALVVNSQRTEYGSRLRLTVADLVNA
jgi:hypothetical protein